MKKLANRKSIQFFSHIKYGERRKTKKKCLDWGALKVRQVCEHILDQPLI